LTHVIDTSGAYIPGHGTPTVVLLGRNQEPVADTIRTVMGTKGEPSTPADPARGQVWTSIVGNIDLPGTHTEFVSVGDTPRMSFNKHPWSIGGGGAAELKQIIEDVAETRLEGLIQSIGFASFTGADEAFICDAKTLTRLGVPDALIKGFISGEVVRDWSIMPDLAAFAPYDENFDLVPLDQNHSWGRWVWRNRTTIKNIVSFGGETKEHSGWWGWYRWIPAKYRNKFSITFAEVASHNHFVFDRGGRVFNQTAPVIKLPIGATEDEHLALLGVLNSSTGCFWMKQVFQNKGSTVDEKGARQTTSPFENFYQHGGTGLKQFPIAQERPLDLACSLDKHAQQLQSLSPVSLAQLSTPNATEWQHAKRRASLTLGRLIALQEELDWHCYKFYDLIGEELTTSQDKVPPIKLGERAFEIVMARRMEIDELKTTWFERHSSTPITEIPTHWPEDYRDLVQRRIDIITKNESNIQLLEQPEYKRRWNKESWDKQSDRALREWLLNRCEESRIWAGQGLTTTAKLTDLVRTDTDFMQVAEMYCGSDHFDLKTLVDDLVRAEAVPFLPVLRYKPSGLRKRVSWEEAWRLQRIEDEIDARTRLDEDDPSHLTTDHATELKRDKVGVIPVPPKYKSEDFKDQSFWRLRGKLDVPKERFISFPHCERDTDQSLVISWAGWDHLQQAKAIAAYFQQMKTEEGWGMERLAPLLAGLVELLPWLFQWHNDTDSNFGLRMSEFYQEFLETESRQLGFTREQLHDWIPPVSPSPRRKRSHK
jgi:hypothetical protein